MNNSGLHNICIGLKKIKSLKADTFLEEFPHDDSAALVGVRTDLMLPQYHETRECLEAVFKHDNLFFSTKTPWYDFPVNDYGDELEKVIKKDDPVFVYGVYRGDNMCVDTQIEFLLNKGYSNIHLIEDMSFDKSIYY